MYGNFWDNLKNAFRHSDNSLYKLIAINVIAYAVVLFLKVIFALSGFREIYDQALTYLMMPASFSWLIKQPWTIFSYMFFHKDFFHILGNMLFLYWFGLLIQEFLGSRKLVNLYILGGLTGGILYLIIYNIAPLFKNEVDSALMLGASAGVLAIVAGAATLSPNTTFHLILIGPVKIVYIAVFYVIYSYVQTIGPNAGGNIAHLGGALLGFLYITQLRKGIDLGIPVQKVGIFFEDLFSGRRSNVKVSYRKEKTTSGGFGSFGSSSSKSATPAQKSDIATQEEIDRILDKIADRGYEALNKEEKRKLFEFSKK